MQRTPVVFAFAIHALVLAGCDRPQQVSVNALAADPASFDEPADGSAAIALPGQEDSP